MVSKIYVSGCKDNKKNVNAMLFSKNIYPRTKKTEKKTHALRMNPILFIF